jgi:hypothetical protein
VLVLGGWFQLAVQRMDERWIKDLPFAVVIDYYCQDKAGDGM